MGSLLPASGHLYRYLAAEFLRTVVRHRGPRSGDPYRETPKFELHRIEKIFTPCLQEKYLAEVESIAKQCRGRVAPLQVDACRVQSLHGINVNEFLLLHGAPSKLIQRLQEHGLDHRYAGEHFGALFGQGSYFAVNSSKSDIYTEPNTMGERCVLVTRVCLGEAFVANEPTPTRKRPPERRNGRGPLNSIVAATRADGGCVEHAECVIFERAQALPQFAIWYKHSLECQCTHCVIVVHVIIRGFTYKFDVFASQTVSTLKD